MIFIFKTGETRAEFETYGAQGETVVGLYDALRSAIIDVTADVVLLEASNAACLAALATMKDARQKALTEQVAAAKAFCTEATEVWLGESVKGKAVERCLLMSFQDGLGKIARRLAAEAAAFAKDMQTANGLSPAALNWLRGLDSEFDRSILPASLDEARIMIDPNETADHAMSDAEPGLTDEEQALADSLLGEETATAGKGNKRRKAQ